MGGGGNLLLKFIYFVFYIMSSTFSIILKPAHTVSQGSAGAMVAEW